MKKNPFTLLAVTLAMTIAIAPAVFPQTLLLEPDTIDFGTVQIGLTGLAESYHQLTVTNPFNEDLEIQLQTSNLPEPESIQLFSPATASIHPILRRIWDAVCCYRQDHLEDPSSTFDLWEGGYLEIEEEYLWRWQFQLIGRDPITQIFAQGQGINALFDCQTQQFTGFNESSEEREPITSINLSDNQSKTFAISFAPRESYEAAGWVSFIWGDQQVHLFVSGRSEFRNTLALSDNSLVFDGTYTNRRAVLPLSILNTSGLPADIDFEITDRDHFYIFEARIEAVHDFILATKRAIDRYVTDNGDSPHSVEELLGLHYLILDDELDRNWTFSLIGNDPVTQIEGVSTAEFPQGAGHVVLFDAGTNQFDGHGFIEAAGDDNLFVAVNRSIDLRVAFKPTDVGEVSDRLLIRSHSQERRDVFETYEVHMIGSGLGIQPDGNVILPNALTLNPAFPNPFNSTTIVSFKSPFTGAVRVSLVDIDGRELKTWIPTSVGMMKEGRFVVDGAGLSAGTYWLKVTQGGQTASTRLVLVK